MNYPTITTTTPYKSAKKALINNGVIYDITVSDKPLSNFCYNYADIVNQTKITLTYSTTIVDAQGVPVEVYDYKTGLVEVKENIIEEKYIYLTSYILNGDEYNGTEYKTFSLNNNNEKVNGTIQQRLVEEVKDNFVNAALSYYKLEQVENAYNNLPVYFRFNGEAIETSDTTYILNYYPSKEAYEKKEYLAKEVNKVVKLINVTPQVYITLDELKDMIIEKASENATSCANATLAIIGKTLQENMEVNEGNIKDVE